MVTSNNRGREDFEKDENIKSMSKKRNLGIIDQ